MRNKNLDPWISEQLPIQDLDAFLQKALSLDANHYKNQYDRYFVWALQGSIYGNNELISGFLSEEDWFENLSPPKRQVIALILNSPRSRRKAMERSRNNMMYFAHMVAELTEWCGYGKTQAIQTIVEKWVDHPTAEKTLEAADKREQKKESLKTQIFREIGKGGKAHDYFNTQVAEIRQRNKERLERVKQRSDG
ncbi:hypothetical protein [Marinobacter sp. MBR-105]|jgi:hypothetical protein